MSSASCRSASALSSAAASANPFIGISVPSVFVALAVYYAALLSAARLLSKSSLAEN